MLQIARAGYRSHGLRGYREGTRETPVKGCRMGREYYGKPGEYHNSEDNGYQDQSFHSDVNTSVTVHPYWKTQQFFGSECAKHSITYLRFRHRSNVDP